MAIGSILNERIPECYHVIGEVGDETAPFGYLRSGQLVWRNFNTVSNENTHLGSECQRRIWVGNTWGNELPAINEDGCLVTIIESSRDFEVVVEVFGRVPLADTTCKVGMNSVGLNNGCSVKSGRRQNREIHTSPGTKLLGTICTIPNRAASGQNWRG